MQFQDSEQQDNNDDIQIIIEESDEYDEQLKINQNELKVNQIQQNELDEKVVIEIDDINSQNSLIQQNQKSESEDSSESHKLKRTIIIHPILIIVEILENNSNIIIKWKKQKKSERILDFIMDSRVCNKDFEIIYEIDGKQKISSSQEINKLKKQIQEQAKVIYFNPEDDKIKLFWNGELDNRIFRYFQSNPFLYCNNCKQNGHIDALCPVQKFTQCIYCLSKIHTSDNCDNVSCFRCNQFGHRKRYCRQYETLPFCVYCAKDSHRESDCGMLISTRRFSEAICLYCGKIGHLDCSKIINK